MSADTSPPTSSPPSSFTVHVDSNAHFMDEDERYTLGEYPTYEEALAAAKRLLNRDLDEHLQKGGAAQSWFDSYPMYGDDPWISPTPEGVTPFSARDFVKALAKEMLG